MGTTGTYLFIPFILLVIGFFVFLFYQVAKSDAEGKQREQTNTSVTRPARAGRGAVGGKSESGRTLKSEGEDSPEGTGESQRDT